jgi:hypothetical protein
MPYRRVRRPQKHRSAPRGRAARPQQTEYGWERSAARNALLIIKSRNQQLPSMLSGTIIYRFYGHVGPDFSDACLRRMDGDQGPWESAL